jgi:lysophospholipase L1-like esterase
MTRRWALASGALATLSLAACQSDSLNQVGPNGSSSFDRYVAIGTSVSMGTVSNGVIYFGQVNSWPAQLARAAGKSFTQPLISSNTTGTGLGLGCPAPLIAPLSFGVLFGGKSVAAADTACSPLVPDVSLPTNNVAIDGARAYNALYSTPDSALAQSIGRAGGKLYSRVLLQAQTQVTAMRAENPTLVSVELGANELLGVSTGILFPSTTGRYNEGSFVPVNVFSPIYDKIIDSVKATGAKALLVAPGVPDVSSFPLFRKGSEIAAQAGNLIKYGVVVAANCSDATGKDNLLSMTKVLVAVATANATKAAVTLSCADAPFTQDGVLTPADLNSINGVQAALTTYIKGKATANGYAYAELGALYNTAKDGRPFNADSLLKSAAPYGPNISLDGVHPTAAGQRIIARAAANALNATYGFDISVP